MREKAQLSNRQRKAISKVWDSQEGEIAYCGHYVPFRDVNLDGISKSLQMVCMHKATQFH
jgi:hypothetical protein